MLIGKHGGRTSTKCNILADGRMIVVGATQPVAHEFLALPRIGDKVVIKIDGGTKAFRVTDVTQYAAGVEGDAQALLAVTSTDGA
jgi:hypothetical protein